MYQESFHVELGVLVNRAWTAPPEYLGMYFTHPSTQRPLSHDLKGSATSQLSAEVGIVHVAVVRVARLHECSLPGSRKCLWSPMVAVVREARLHEHLLPGSRKRLWSPTVCGRIWGPAEPLWSQSMKEWGWSLSAVESTGCCEWQVSETAAVFPFPFLGMRVLCRCMGGVYNWLLDLQALTLKSFSSVSERFQEFECGWYC